MFEDQPVTQIVDGGYLTWVYGAIGYKSWVNVRGQYTRRAGVLICLDSPVSNRKYFYPEYKSHRAERRLERQEVHDRVKHFQEYVREDPTLRTLECIGCEADDLIAILHGRYHLPVIGADKDLMQLPELSLKNIAGDSVSLAKFVARQPKQIQPRIKTPAELLLTLCLMGDKSDDIPRLIPPKNLGLFNSILMHEKPWHVALDLYKDEFYRNLMLAVLPSPWCYDPVPDHHQVLELVASNQWPHHQTFLRYDISTILTSLEQKNVLVRRTSETDQ